MSDKYEYYYLNVVDRRFDDRRWGEVAAKLGVSHIGFWSSGRHIEVATLPDICYVLTTLKLRRDLSEHWTVRHKILLP
jgi:hypothetical protein